MSSAPATYTDTVSRKPHIGCGVALLLLVTIVAGCQSIPNIRSAAIRRLTGVSYSQIAWSPDSTRFLAVGLPSAPSTASNLYLVDANTGRAERLSEIPDEYSFPRWSPVGNKISFALWPAEVWTYDIQDRQLALLSHGEAAVWSPSGDQIAVYVGSTVNDAPATPQMRFFAADGTLIKTIDLGPIGTIRQTLARGEAPLDAHEYLAGLAWSSTHERIAFSLYTIIMGADDIHESYVLDLASGQVDSLLLDQSVGPLAFSPAGDYLAYVNLDDLGIWGSLRVADGSGKCLYVPDIPPEARDVTWSPDGRTLGFLFHSSIHTLDMSRALLLAEGNTGCP